ncbi:hypothetical protein [Jatrophihabitans sp.]|uniref:hypothetical protein n=1 Tax=Jatrophihabitans sp. TaxID=1932789 RepID=UPI002EE0D85D
MKQESPPDAASDSHSCPTRTLSRKEQCVLDSRLVHPARRQAECCQLLKGKLLLATVGEWAVCASGVADGPIQASPSSGPLMHVLKVVASIVWHEAQARVIGLWVVEGERLLEQLRLTWMGQPQLGLRVGGHGLGRAAMTAW